MPAPDTRTIRRNEGTRWKALSVVILVRRTRILTGKYPPVIGLGECARHRDGSVFRIAQLPALAELRGGTCAWVQWRKISRFVRPVAWAGPLKPGVALAIVTVAAGIAAHDQAMSLGAWRGRRL